MDRFKHCFWLLFLLLVACTSTEDDLFGSLSGNVTDADTKEPLKGVSVSLSLIGETKLTGSDGSYTFLNLDPTEYTLTFKKDGYETDTKRVSVIAGENTRVDMVMTPLRPQFSVSLKTLEFGTENTTLTLDISNAGHGVLQWIITEDIEWLECKPLSGNTEKEAASVVVTVSREGWAKGDYSRTFAISSNGGSEVITVTMSVDGSNLSVLPEEIDFGTTESTAQLTLTNKGKGTVSYQATSSNDWLNLSKTSGKVTDKDYITVTVNRGALAAGEYTGQITITADEDAINIPVKLSISAKERPVVSLDEIKNVAYNGATVTGTIVSLGNSKVTRYGFCWSQKAEPTIEDASTNMGDCNVPLSFEGIITDLAANTKYYIRAYAENNEGISYSNEESFTTAGVPVIPTVQTQQTTDIGSNKATAHGQISSLGNVTEVTQYGHVWSSASEQPDINLSTKTTLGKTDKPITFVSEMTELKPNQKYYVRAYATNEKGTAYGDVLEFTTSKADMTLTTSEVTSIVHNAATCGGSINDYGGHSVKECGVCWSVKEEAVSVADSKATGTLKDNAWSCRMEGLNKETVYYARAYVETAEGTVFYGEVRKFTTTQELKLPTVGKVSITGIDTQGATLQSSVTDNGNSEVTACGFCWSTQTDPTIEGESIACQLQNGAFGQKLSGLKDGTKYYVRAYATNAMGTAYSENAELTTTAITVPEWGNASVTNVGKTKATVNAALTSNGNADITEMGICWATHPQATIYDSKQVCNTSDAIAIQLTGLTGTTTYYVCAYATNSKGTGYSNEVTFTTTDSEVDVWDGTSVATSFAGGTGTATDPIRIETAAQLRLLADKVNAGTTYSGIYFRLTSNISLNNKSWDPIGGSKASFGGHFDGGNNAITGLFINSKELYAGLFAYADGASFSNLNVTGNVKSNSGSTTQSSYASIFCGAAEGTTFDRIRVSGTLTPTGYNYSGAICGGFINYSTCTAINCINESEVHGSAGIVGVAYVASTIANCANYGKIDGSGGILGYTNVKNMKIYNCCNHSTVTGRAIVGRNYYSISVENCFWLNNVVENIGNEHGFEYSYETSKNVGYYIPNSSTCVFTSHDSADVIKLLNEWVEENGSDTYRKWEYTTVDGYACPVMK